MNLFDAYFFDFDGTVGDTEPDIRAAWLAALDDLNLSDDGFDQRFYVGPSIQETSKMLLPDAGESIQTALWQTYKIFYDNRESYSSLPYPGVMDMISRLHRNGKKVYIVTNKRMEPLLKIIRQFQMVNFLSGIFTPDIADGNYLSKNELLALALRISAVPKSRCIMIGDTDIDIAAAQNNGIVSCGATWGYGSPDSIAAAKPDFIINAPCDLPQ